MEELMADLIDSLDRRVHSQETRKDILMDLIPRLEETDPDLIEQLRADSDTFNEAFLAHSGETEEDLEEDED